jgi:two-component system, LytTR family, sensor kinase
MLSLNFHGNPERTETMALFPRRLRELSFWHYQIAGWLLMAVFHSSVASVIWGWNAGIFFNVGTFIATGFLLTTLLRYPYRYVARKRLPAFRLTAVIVAGSMAAALAWLAVEVLMKYAEGGVELVARVFTPVFSLVVLAYAFPDKLAWSALFFGIRFWRDWLQEHEQAEAAAEELERIQLQTLRYRLNPEFLFGSIDHLRGLIAREPSHARRMITDLAEFLRYSLVTRNTPVVALRDEIEAMCMFLSVEQHRTDGRLTYACTMSDEAGRCTIPAFALHPLVMHALHAVRMDDASPFSLTIAAGVEGGMVRVTLTAGGPSIHRDNSVHGRVRSGLDELLPAGHTLAVDVRDGAMCMTLEYVPVNGEVHEELPSYSHR